jgi:hypothetical protein
VNVQAKKKLIDFGWNSPFSFDLRKHIEKYEKPPFDGVGIKLPAYVGGGNIFMVNDLRNLSADSLALEQQWIAEIRPSKILTDNFIVIYGASQMNWFSDEDWAVTEKNIRYAAQLAKIARCKGILWDPEPYKPGKNPWKYIEQDGIDKKSYAEFYQQVRKRGAQFIKALQEEYPGLTILSLRELSDYQHGSPFSEPLFPVVNAKEVEKRLPEMWSGLHLPFITGILDAIDDRVTFIDANEEAYYYTSELEFYKIYNQLKTSAKALLPPEIQPRYIAKYDVGHAISVDYIAGHWANVISFPFKLSGQGKMLTPKEQALWFEHNAYYALKTSDQYAWLYTEESNWFTGERIPAGFTEALLRAKEKVNSNRPLGFSVEEMLVKAREKAAKFQPEKKK